MNRAPRVGPPTQVGYATRGMKPFVGRSLVELSKWGTPTSHSLDQGRGRDLSSTLTINLSISRRLP